MNQNLDEDLILLAFHLAGGMGSKSKRKILEFYKESGILFSLEESDFRSDSWLKKGIHWDSSKEEGGFQNTKKWFEREEDLEDLEEFWTLKRKNWLEREWVKKKGELVEKAKEEQERVEKLGAKVMNLASSEYPSALKQMEDSPIVLYYKGELSLKDFSSVSVVGSRKSSWNGLRNSYDLAFDLAERGVTVVSGIAKGVDSKAHKGALEAGGRTIGVLGCGIDRVYPKESKALYEEIIHSGCILSEFSVGMPPMARNFPIRNRVIAGLSVATVLVEASRDSGALYTAGYALEYGREVYAFPGPANSPNYSGTHWLIQNGAHLIESSEDLLEDLSLVLNLERKMERKTERKTERKIERKRNDSSTTSISKERSISKKKSLDLREKKDQKPVHPGSPERKEPNISLLDTDLLDADSKKIWNSLSRDRQSVDQVVEKTGFSIDRVLTLLMELEMKGYCTQEDGQYSIE